MTARIRTFVVEPPSGEVRRSLERLASAEGVVHVAAMPDVHLAHEVCVGVAVATEGIVIPAAVGGDIGCGMAALAFDAGADVLADERAAARVLHALYEAVPCLKQPRPAPLPTALASTPLSAPALEQVKGRDGRYQLGTLGRGNHFVELQADEHERLWLMVHTGSRGMGGRIRDHHLAHARTDPRSGLAFLREESAEGRAYLADMAWALAYAEANRAAIVEAAARALCGVLDVEAEPSSLRTCHHNHVAAECHEDRAVLVHRKGAIRAGEGAEGIVPGSMGTASFHTVGRACAEALASSSHGAGRRMSRSEARRRVRRRSFEREMQGIWFDRRRVRDLCDEAPEAYRDIHAVMRAQRRLTKVVRRLRPLLSFKYAG